MNYDFLSADPIKGGRGGARYINIEKEYDLFSGFSKKARQPYFCIIPNTMYKLERIWKWKYINKYILTNTY